VTELDGLDVLVINVATQEPIDDLGELSSGQWERTSRVNVHSCFWTTSSSPAGGCPAATPEKSSPPSATRPSPGN
jgi:NAD(P)-dependent dehydrogenase (short-subunit alcohol dehydrogenase family)